jgi:hypothetical protein
MQTIPKEHQGETFKNSKELGIGDRVLDVFLNRDRVVTVVKRHKISVLLSYVDERGNTVTYVESLRNLRRVPALQ